MTPAEIVEAYLAAHMIPDPIAASAFVAPEFEITFTGGRKMKEPAEATAFNARRYKWVKKRFERTETVAGGSPEEAVVYSLGTLYGEWPDGTAFEGNRYIDRFVVRHGKIIQQSVWNDSAEILLDRAGLVPQDRL
jgi:ketosteroid isomerase-like protein